MFDMVFVISWIVLVLIIGSFVMYFYNEFKYKKNNSIKEKVIKNDLKIQNTDINDLVSSANERNKRINEQREEQ